MSKPVWFKLYLYMKSFTLFDITQYKVEDLSESFELIEFISSLSLFMLYVKNKDAAPMLLAA